MLRNTMIALLTAAALTGGLTADAFARGGGGGHGGGFGGGYDDWCSEYPYYTQNCYLYGY